MTLDEDFAELLLDSSFALRMTDEELLDFTELDEALSTLLLDTLVSLELDCGVTLDEDFTELLLGTLDDEDFAFSLLLDSGSRPGMTDEDDSPCSIEEDDSTPGSSFGPVEDEESSPQAANNIAAAPIATRNFLIKPPANRYNKNLFVRRNRAILIWSFFHQSAEIIILEAKKRYI